MSLFDQLGGILQQYSGGSAPANPEQASDHLGQVAQQTAPAFLAGALTRVFQSPQTGSFGQNISSMFDQSNPQQRAGIINQLLPYAGSAGLGGLLGGVLSGMGGGYGAQPQVTPELAQQIPPQAVEQLANHAAQQNPSVMEQAGNFYSQHPTLVKALGAGAAIIALRHIAEAEQH